MKRVAKPPPAPEEFDETTDLPDGWASAPLGEISSHIQYGYTASAIQAPKGPRFLRITDIQNGKVKWDSVPSCEITKEDAEKYGLRSGDIVFARTGATTGKSFLIDSCPQAVFASYLIRVRSNNLMNPAFLVHSFNTPAYWRFITDNVAGNAQPNCNASKLAALPVRIAPLKEQARIVCMTEKLLKEIGNSREHLAKVPKLLKAFRQSVLVAACSGRLTEDWRLKNHPEGSIQDVVEAVRGRRLKSVKTPIQQQTINHIYSTVEENDSSELPDTWAFVTLNKLCTSFDYGTSAKSQPIGKIPVLRMGNIQNGEIDWENLVYTSKSEEIKQYRLEPNTVLFNRTNSPELVGKTAIYRGEHQAIFAGYLIRIVNTPELDPEYLNLCLNTPYARGFCSQIKTDGVSQSNINAQKLSMFEVPFCLHKEQEEVVRRVKGLFKLADAIEKHVEGATKRADKLTLTVLAKAFRGELVPTEAELALKEGREYEQASKLLERIKTER